MSTRLSIGSSFRRWYWIRIGTLILNEIRDSHLDRITATFTIFPSPKVSDVVVEPYNAALSIHYLIEDLDETFVLDNDALFNIVNKTLKQNIQI